uniref:EMI domain-containing protein n=1 Tax=Hippocampus comes TaxID=109280 RepID=A0A3Q2YDR9_HIPCM
MTAMRVALVLLAFLLSTRGDVRARDPEVEQEEDEQEDWGTTSGVISATEETPLMQDGGNYPATLLAITISFNIVNWCAFVQKRVVTVAVACGTEKYTIKSQSPCPSGTPDCHLVMYKLSTRPLYRQQQKETTALLWRCCPGHRGDNCDDTGAYLSYVASSRPFASNTRTPHKREEEEEAEATSHPAVPAALPLPHMVALLMSQLQRPLQLFNHSLEQLDRRLGELARDVAELKGARRLERDLRDDYERRLDAKVEQSVRQVAALREQLESGLHSQQAMLHYNMSNLKADLDLKLKRHNKMLQVRTCTRTPRTHPHALRLVNVLVVTEKFVAVCPLKDFAHAATSQVSTDALWDAIERLDNRVVNNTIVDRLAEDLALTSGGVRQLRRDAKALGERLNQTARTGQVLFMETGLEVEAAKVAVLERVEQLAGNLSRQGQRLHELDVDVDYLYAVLYKNNASSSSPPQCDCGRLGEAVARLEGGVANATELATENRLALEDERRAAAEARPWEAGAGDWETAVEALQTSLQQVGQVGGTFGAQCVCETCSLREEMKRVLAEMKRLSASFNSLLKDVIRHSDVLEILLGEEVLEFLEWPAQDQEAHSIPALKERLGALRQTSDEPGAVGRAPFLPCLGGNLTARHRTTLSAIHWTAVQLLNCTSRVAIVSQLHKSVRVSYLRGRERRAALDFAPVIAGDAEEAPSADAPSFRSNEGGGPMSAGDGGDLWKLERSVEQLEAKLQRLEEAPCCRDAGDGEGEAEEEEAALRTEVARLKRGLEEHLRTFKDVLGNADVLERSAPRTVAAQGKKKRGRGGHHRNGREAPGEAHRLT